MTKYVVIEGSTSHPPTPVPGQCVLWLDSTTKAPRFKNSDGLDVAPVGAVEARRFVGAAGQPAFATGWSNLGAGFEDAHFWKDPLGLVHVGGTVIRSALGTGLVFTLPVGYRPAGSRLFACDQNPLVHARVALGADGTVTLGSPGVTVVYLSLDGISFRAA